MEVDLLIAAQHPTLFASSSVPSDQLSCTTLSNPDLKDNIASQGFENASVLLKFLTSACALAILVRAKSLKHTSSSICWCLLPLWIPNTPWQTSLCKHPLENTASYFWVHDIEEAPKGEGHLKMGFVSTSLLGKSSCSALSKATRQGKCCVDRESALWTAPLAGKHHFEMSGFKMMSFQAPP